MSCLIKIRTSREQMSANDKKIADYLLQNSVLLRDYSSQQLASAVGVSQSSIVKFCQKLGYKGYPDLKWAINEDVAISSTSDLNGKQHFDHQQLNQISDKLLQGKLNSVRATIDSNEEKPFIEAAHLMADAQRLYVLSSGRSQHMADYLVFQLMGLGKVAFNTQDAQYRDQFLNQMQAGDLVMVLSHVEDQALGTQQIKSLRSKQVGIVSIGKESAQPSAVQPDIRLKIVADTSQESLSGSAYERAAQQHVIDILLLLLNDQVKT